MIYLVDTNVLLHSIQRAHPMHADAERATTQLISEGQELSIIAQNLIECWAVATRPSASNGLGLSVNETVPHVVTFKETFSLLPDTSDIFLEWERLVSFYQVAGRKVHDARLVAAMNVHRITHLFTFNTDDFKRYSAITLVSPSSVK